MDKDNQVKMAAALDLFRKLSEPQKISYLSRLRSLALHPKTGTRKTS